MLRHQNLLQLYNVDELQLYVGDMKQHLIFVHAISGCDTVSVPYTKGKNKAIGVLSSYGDQDYLSTFTEPRGPPEDITNVGVALHVCCESWRAVVRQVVGRHADARGQGCTVHPCAVTALDKYAATFMH